MILFKYNIQIISKNIFLRERNWVFATNLHFLTSISMQPDGVLLWYFNLRLFDLPELIVWNIKGLGKRVAELQELKNLSLWQKLNTFGNKRRKCRLGELHRFPERTKFFRKGMMESFWTKRTMDYLSIYLSVYQVSVNL